MYKENHLSTNLISACQSHIFNFIPRLLGNSSVCLPPALPRAINYLPLPLQAPLPPPSQAAQCPTLTELICPRCPSIQKRSLALSPSRSQLCRSPYRSSSIGRDRDANTSMDPAGH
ncbi:hypothetical protein BJY00DRAFT_273505, partial [Aspergillus carlsbadensis]